MPVTIVVEDGSCPVGANAYASIANADAYHAGSINGLAWDGVPDADQRARALVQATRTLDSLCDWPGQRATLTQALDWPRSGVVYRGLNLGTAVVPVALVQATCEFARLLLTVGDPTLDGDDAGNIASETIGPLKTDYRAPAGYGDKAAQLDQALPRSVMAILRPLLAGVGSTGGSAFVPFVRV